MAFKLIVLAAALAVANAGYLGGYAAPAYATSYAAPALVSHGIAAPAAVTSQSANILRSYGNLGQVSTYSKTIDTPYSSVRKSDVRVSNPGLATAYAAPAIAHGYAAPAIAHGYAAPAIATTYAAPALAHGYAAPALAHGYAAAPALAARAGLLGVAYSAAPVVSHMTYSNSYGINYGW